MAAPATPLPPCKIPKAVEMGPLGGIADDAHDTLTLTGAKVRELILYLAADIDRDLAIDRCLRSRGVKFIETDDAPVNPPPAP